MRIAPRNFWDLMTLTNEVAPSTGYELVNTQNTRRSSFWRSPDTTGQYVRGSLASGSVSMNCFFMFRHHCHGGSVRARGFSNNDWTGTTLFDTGTVSVFTPIATGYDWGYAEYTGLDTHDPLGLDSPFYVYFTEATGVKSVQVDFSSKSTTYGFAYWEVGRFFFGQYLEPTRGPRFGMTLGFGDGDERERTRGGTLQTGLGETWPILNFDLNGITDAEMAPWIDIMRYAQTGRDVAISIYPGSGGRKERDLTINGKLAALDALGREVNRLTKRVQIEGC